METTDIHVNVMPYDYYADKPNDTMGLARTASLIDSIRAEAGNSMLIDNGDFLQGNPMGDYMAYLKGMKPGDVHPVIKAMNKRRRLKPSQAGCVLIDRTNQTAGDTHG